MSKYSLAINSWDQKEYDALQSVIKSGKFTMGESVAAYEKEFAKYLNTNYCVMTSSGSTANLIGIAALFFKKNSPLNPGDEVIVPAVSWSTTYYPLQQYGLKLKFVDIDLLTLNYNLEDLNNAVTDKTKLIVCVNLLGNPNDFDSIQEIIKDRDILLFEDNCESLGARYNEKQAGTFGITGTFSSFFSHHISTMEGGIVATDDEEIYHILLSLRAHGWTRDLPDINHVSNKSSDSFSESFRFVLPGYNVRPLEMSGALGLEQLKKLPDFINTRRKNAKYFYKKISKFSKFYLQKEISESSWFGFSLIIVPGANITRDKVLDLLSQNDIDFRPIVTGDFTQNEVMKYFDFSIHKELKNAKYLHENGFFVGNTHEDLTNEIDLLANVLGKL